MAAGSLLFSGSFRDFISKLRDTRAFTVLEYSVAENKEQFASVPEQLQLLEKIQVTRDLDEIYLYCAQYLGNEDDVQQLLEWLRKKPQKVSLRSLDDL